MMTGRKNIGKEVPKADRIKCYANIQDGRVNPRQIIGPILTIDFPVHMALVIRVMDITIIDNPGLRTVSCFGMLIMCGINCIIYIIYRYLLMNNNNIYV